MARPAPVLNKLNVVNEMIFTEITLSQKDMVEKMVNGLQFGNVDFIITKLVINGWPKNVNKAAKKIKYDTFCYHYALGFCQYEAKECQKYNRNHSKLFNLQLLYNNGKCSIENKRRAYYLCYYLGKYCNYGNSTQLNQFMKIIRKDKDFKKLLIRYPQKWANNIVNTMVTNVNKSITNNNTDHNQNNTTIPSEQSSETSGYTYTTNTTNNTSSTFGW